MVGDLEFPGSGSWWFPVGGVFCFILFLGAFRVRVPFDQLSGPDQLSGRLVTSRLERNRILGAAGVLTRRWLGGELNGNTSVVGVEKRKAFMFFER